MRHFPFEVVSLLLVMQYVQMWAQEASLCIWVTATMTQMSCTALVPSIVTRYAGCHYGGHQSTDVREDHPSL